MKSSIKILAIALVTITSIVGCSKSDSSMPPVVVPESIPVTLVGNGDWKIILFSEKEENYTSYFSTHAFKFDHFGTAVATNRMASVTGTWHYGQEVNPVKFSINFNVAPLNKLNKEWELVMQTATMVEFKHNNGGENPESIDTDYLTFKKIQENPMPYPTPQPQVLERN